MASPPSPANQPKVESNNPFKAPTLDRLKLMTFDVNSTLLPSTEEFKLISEDWAKLGISGDSLTENAMKLATFCYHSGSSTTTEMRGESSKPGVSLSRLAGVVNMHTSLRKFCRYFAPLIWNIHVESKIPPAAWQSKDFKEGEKFAAFDFFDGVENVGSIKPPGGLIRKPTDKERIANATARALKLFEAAAQQNRMASNSVHYTQGRYSDTAPQIQFLPDPE
ncbi:coat protein [Tamus red mosaic virus]|uniref:Coat protein n=1 Tax=Tamus red mosaic virus TaxID=1081702 RepID=G3LHV8_9VIRU|nr:coat protein [Tamus red mosaic virus]AEO12144.1 coat protein [Tamus red mosaic virus]